MDEFADELLGDRVGILVPPTDQEMVLTLRLAEEDEVVARHHLRAALVEDAAEAMGAWSLSAELREYAHEGHPMLRPQRLPSRGAFLIDGEEPVVTSLELSRGKCAADLSQAGVEELRIPRGIHFSAWRAGHRDDHPVASYTLVVVYEPVDAPGPAAGEPAGRDPDPDTVSSDEDGDVPGAEQGGGAAGDQADGLDAMFGGLGWPEPLADDAADGLLGESSSAFPSVAVTEAARFWLKDSACDFVNASRVLGWRRDATEDAGYHLSQMPFSPETVADFWRVIWQAKCGTVCVLLPSSAFPLWSQVQNLKKPYKPFWPTRSQEVAYFGAGSRWTIKCEEAVENVEWTSYFLLICRTPPMSKSGKAAPLMGAVHTSLCVRFVHYEAWQREKAPPQDVLRLLGRLHLFKDSANLKNKTKHSAIALVCPTVVERCRLAPALDMAARKLLSVRLVDVQRQVSLLRRDRHGAMSKAWEYLWLHDRLLHLCLTTDILGPKQRRHLGRSLLDLSSNLSPDARSTVLQSLTTDILGPKQRAHLGHPLNLSSHLSPDPDSTATHLPSFS